MLREHGPSADLTMWSGWREATIYSSVVAFSLEPLTEMVTMHWKLESAHCVIERAYHVSLIGEMLSDEHQEV